LTLAHLTLAIAQRLSSDLNLSSNLKASNLKECA